jgi:hypothetical protein
MNKFEQLLDYIVNEEKEKAEELFHEIVVEKSRDIYENLIGQEEELATEAKEEDKEEDEEQDESMEEAFGMEDEAEGGEVGGDATDDFNADTADTDGPGAEDGEEAGDVDGDGTPATADDVQDLADALDELKAEFAKLIAGEKHEEEEDPDVHGGALDDIDGADSEEDEDEEEDEGMSQFESRSTVREYTETVGKPYGSGNGISNKSEQGDGKAGPINANPKNRPSGGNVSAHNIAQGDTGEAGIKGGEGLVGGVKGKFTSPNTHNVDGVKSGIKTLNKQGSGYPGNNKTAGPVGSGTGDKAGQTSVGSPKSVVDHKQG